MKLDGIIAFVTVADCASINEAARQLRLSKSTVSERLTELEHALGTRLLHRNSRQFALTEDGAALLERARRIVAETEEAKEDLARRRGEVSGPLRIAVPRAFGDLHLGPILYDFMARYPDVTVTADFDDRISDLGSAFDAIVRIAPADLPKLATETLTVSRRALVAAPAYLDRYGRPANVGQLGQHKAIHYMDRGPDDWSFRAEIERVVARVEPRLRVTSCYAMRDAAIAGLGIAWLPTFHSYQAIKAGTLEMLDIGVDPDVTPITIAYHQGMGPAAKLRAMIDHLKLAFGNPPYWDEGLVLPDARRQTETATPPVV
jgi:DNA-binding transcriptional LysR family regulator